MEYQPVPVDISCLFQHPNEQQSWFSQIACRLTRSRMLLMFNTPTDSNPIEIAGKINERSNSNVYK